MFRRRVVRYARFGGLFNEVWKMSFQGKKIQILVFYPPLIYLTWKTSHKLWSEKDITNYCIIKKKEVYNSNPVNLFIIGTSSFQYARWYLSSLLMILIYASRPLNKCKNCIFIAFLSLAKSYTTRFHQKTCKKGPNSPPPPTTENVNFEHPRVSALPWLRKTDLWNILHHF